METASFPPLELIGQHVTLRILSAEDRDEILKAGSGVNWSWMFSALDSPEAVNEWVNERLLDFETGISATYVVRKNSSGKVVGSTAFMDIRGKDKGLEIGMTWYSPSAQGTHVNPECKFLLLQYAFESWGALRVQLKTDNMNAQSQNALAKLGAHYEGELRNHIIRRDGTVRHTRMYSITREEWPRIKECLRERLL